MQLYVAERAERRGIGERLVDEVLRYAFEGLALHQVELGVVEHNHSAIRLYEQKGFREYGRLEHCFCVEGVSSTQLLMVVRSKTD